MRSLGLLVYSGFGDGGEQTLYDVHFEAGERCAWGVVFGRRVIV